MRAEDIQRKPNRSLNSFQGLPGRTALGKVKLWVPAAERRGGGMRSQAQAGHTDATEGEMGLHHLAGEGRG